MNPKYLSIPKPCREDWNSMNATEQGAFCSKCTKEVLDCSKMGVSEFQKSLETAQSLCVRIRQKQIDEINFLEWFGHLSIRKQIRYAFLFALVLVFGQPVSSSAQPSETDTLIQPQHVSIDSSDILTPEELMESYKMVDEVDQIVAFGKPTDNNKKEILSPEYIDPWIIGDIIAWDPPIKVDAFKDPTKMPPNPVPQSIENNPYIQLNGNNYSFFFTENTLVFHANGRKKTAIQLTIKHEERDELIYLDPIQVKEGTQSLSFNLEGIESGVYVLTLEEADQQESIRIPIW